MDPSEKTTYAKPTPHDIEAIENPVGNLGAQIEREREKLKTKIERILCSLFDEHGLVCQSIDIKPTIIGDNTGRSSILYYAKITFKN